MQTQRRPRANPAVSFEPVSSALGAMINGLDVDAIDAATSGFLTEALHRHGVLFYRHPDDTLDARRFVKLAQAFGEIDERQYGKTINPTDDPRINYIDSEVTSAKDYRINVWHTDGTPEECPPGAALLNPVVMPGRGGDTMWACMHAAWETLSSRYQAFLDGLEAVHTTERAYRQMSSGARSEVYGDGSKATHPVVCADPVTGRRMLYVNANYTERILGLSDTESASVLAMLFQHINTPEFHVRWRWRTTDVAIWNERTTQHRAVADYEGRRLIRRIVIRGARPA
jgi:taurine dioxygenase